MISPSYTDVFTKPNIVQAYIDSEPFDNDEEKE